MRAFAVNVLAGMPLTAGTLRASAKAHSGHSYQFVNGTGSTTAPVLFSWDVVTL
jgi:hypothetical protein